MNKLIVVNFTISADCSSRETLNFTTDFTNAVDGDPIKIEKAVTGPENPINIKNIEVKIIEKILLFICNRFL